MHVSLPLSLSPPRPPSPLQPGTSHGAVPGPAATAHQLHLQSKDLEVFRTFGCRALQVIAVILVYMTVAWHAL